MKFGNVASYTDVRTVSAVQHYIPCREKSAPTLRCGLSSKFFHHLFSLTSTAVLQAYANERGQISHRYVPLLNPGSNLDNVSTIPFRMQVLDHKVVVSKTQYPTYHCEIAGADAERAKQLFNHRFLRRWAY